MQAQNPGIGYEQLLNKLQLQDRAEFYPARDKPVVGPAEEKAKARLTEILVERHMPARPYREGTDALYERAEEDAYRELNRLVKANPDSPT